MVRRYEQPAFKTWKFNSYSVKYSDKRREVFQLLRDLVKFYLGCADEFTKEMKQLTASAVRGT